MHSVTWPGRWCSNSKFFQETLWLRSQGSEGMSDYIIDFRCLSLPYSLPYGSLANYEVEAYLSSLSIPFQWFFFFFPLGFSSALISNLCHYKSLRMTDTAMDLWTSLFSCGHQQLFPRFFELRNGQACNHVLANRMWAKVRSQAHNDWLFLIGTGLLRIREPSLLE